MASGELEIWEFDPSDPSWSLSHCHVIRLLEEKFCHVTSRLAEKCRNNNKIDFTPTYLSPMPFLQLYFWDLTHVKRKLKGYELTEVCIFIAILDQPLITHKNLGKQFNLSEFSHSNYRDK